MHPLHTQQSDDHSILFMQYCNVEALRLLIEPGLLTTGMNTKRYRYHELP